MAQTATFTQDTYNRGETIVANFTWSGATECQGQGSLRAWYYIFFPDGSQAAYGESTIGTSSAVLSYPTNGSSPLGTYTAQINIFTNYNNCPVASASDTCILQTAPPQCSITMAYTGQGTVSVNPSGCLWPNYCDCGTPITISATAAQGWMFNGWIGSGAGSYTGMENPHTMILSANISETAHFIQTPQYNWHVSETSHDFGNIPVNECSEIYPITVYNDSDIQLDFSSTCQSGSCDPFNPPRVFWSTGIASIPAHGSYNFGVQFCPLGTTMYQCVYRIVCLTQNGSPEYIDLSYTGTGTEAFTIGGIDLDDSIFYTEFTSGQQNALIAQIRLMNTGGADGLIYTKYFYQAPGGQWIQLTDRFEQFIAAGDSTWAFHYGNIPDISGDVLFGVKVWGEDEIEPPTLSIIFSSTVFSE